jgi:hypothetical protein
MLKRLKEILLHVWHGVLEALGGALLTGLLIVAGAVGAALIGWWPVARAWVASRSPASLFVVIGLLVVLILVLGHSNRRLRGAQRGSLSVGDGEFVTHFGVWWRVFEDAAFVEDMPYCPCCDPHQKLIQTAGPPLEKYVCPRTKNEIQLFDVVPRPRQQLLDELHRAYNDRGRDLYRHLHGEFQRLKKLRPGTSDQEILGEMINKAPLARLPEGELQKILAVNREPYEVFDFLRQHYPAYRRYLRRRDSGRASFFRRLTRKGRQLARFTLPWASRPPTTDATPVDATLPLGATTVSEGPSKSSLPQSTQTKEPGSMI